MQEYILAVPNLCPNLCPFLEDFGMICIPLDGFDQGPGRACVLVDHVAIGEADGEAGVPAQVGGSPGSRTISGTRVTSS